MSRIPLQSLARLALLVVGALVVVDWLSQEGEKVKAEGGKEGEEKPDAKAPEEPSAKSEEPESPSDDDKDVEGDAVVDQ
jgi:hypothetical protein